MYPKIFDKAFNDVHKEIYVQHTSNSYASAGSIRGGGHEKDSIYYSYKSLIYELTLNWLNASYEELKEDITGEQSS
jgi:hypothetical protein